MNILAQHISKRFGSEPIIDDFSYDFISPAKIGLLGINGSGKSTLLQMLSGFLTPSQGKILFTHHQKPVDEADRFQYVSIAAPYVELIEELTLMEFFTYHFGFKHPLKSIPEIVQYIGLEKAKHKTLSHFSSGMKQRVKLAQAVFSDTPILLLDEPCSNLDSDGIHLYKQMMDEFTGDRLLIIASNDKQEYEVCDTFIDIMKFKPVEE